MTNPCQAPYWSTRDRFWHVTRYAEVAALLERQDLGVSDIGNAVAEVASRSGTDLSGLIEALARIPVFLNPPAHGPERRIFARTLAGASAADIERIVLRYLAGIRRTALDAGGMDAASDFSDVIAMGVLADLMDLPEADIPMLNELTRGVLALTNRGISLPLLRTLNAKACQCIDYLVDVVRRRRARPGDDAVSRMLALVGDEDERHAASRLYALLMVGTETSATFLSHSALRLIEHPEEREMLAGRPDMLERGVEELIRLSTPARFSTRWSRVDAAIGDVVVPAGQGIMLDFHAANRDPAVFQRPDAVDLENTVPHLSFSEGLHLCLGSRFARIEGRLGVAELLALPPMRLVRETTAVPGIDLLPRLQSLPVEFI